MRIKDFIQLDLRRLILMLAVMSALITLANGFFATYHVQRQQLIDSTLEANRLYAAKLASSTAIFFDSTQRQLAFSARVLSREFNSASLRQAETDRLLQQTNTFNSVAVVNANGVVLATSPETIQMKGHKLATPGALQALRDRTARISEPYVSAAGNLVIFISAPIIDDGGTYLGYVGGAIYLKQKSILNELLGQDSGDQSESSTFVIDGDRQILYHKNPARIGQPIGGHLLGAGGLLAKSGGSHEISRDGINSLVGYAVIPAANWTVVTVKATNNTLVSLRGMMLNVLNRTMPLTLITLLAVWLFARLISQPLWQLARSANEMDRIGISEELKRISSWYFEVAQLKRAMLLGINLLQNKIGKLKTEAQTDPLTGLFNRRGLSSALEYYRADTRAMAVIALDIDRFKQVNDTYGHDVGDEVIKVLAQLLRAGSRLNDILCRNGGEEFLMVLPETNLAIAAEIAERLRANVAATSFPTAGRMTISLGVAIWTPESEELASALKMADDALYRAKHQGRNQVAIA